MKKIQINDPESKSLDFTVENFQKLKNLFPEIILENPNGDEVINLESLRLLIGDKSLAGSEERYGLNWVGKRKSRQMALTPSIGTLLPDIGDSVNWDTTKNILIQGDNLEVLKLLQKSYARKVKAIYIDPPYNTGRNLIYPNDYHDGIRTYLEVTGQAEGQHKLSSNPEAGGRFHTNWLSMIYPRLRLARNLLAEDGVLIATIDDNEQANLGVILREVFEEGNYDHVCVPIIHNPRGIQGENFSYVHEYAFFVFKKGTKAINDRKIEQSEIDWSQFRNWGTESERADAKNCFYPVILKDGEIIGFGDVSKDDFHPKQTEVIDGETFVYPIDKSGIERKWRYARQSVDAIKHLLKAKKTSTGYEIEIGKDFGLYKTIWNDKRYDANEYGTKIVGELVPNSPFTFPKSLWAVHDSLMAVVGNDPNALVLDFFAGSGTTGHAVYEINKADGGNRRYILVQLPELIDEGGEFKTIFDVTKARLKTAATNLAAEDSSRDIDYGFRVFKLDASNIRVWNSMPENLEASLLEHENHIIENRDELDIFYEILLKLGIDLSVEVKKKQFGKFIVYSAAGGRLMACLSNCINDDDIVGLASHISDWHKELPEKSDTTLIFLDSAFNSDSAKTNITAILNQHGIQGIRSL